MPIRCLLVDDHTLFRAGLRRLLEAEEDFEVVGEAGDAKEALEISSDLHPDVVLMDIGMPGMSSFEAARLMRERSLSARLILLTMYEEEEYLLQALERGAAGYVLKDTPAAKLIDAVREVHRGGRYVSRKLLGKLAAGLRPSSGREKSGDSLTPREREVVKLIAEGSSVRQIASRLRLSIKTVEAHKFNLMRKLRIHNKAQLVTYAIQKKIVRMPMGA
jgi:two-component system, NarL family, response regulator NreC